MRISDWSSDVCSSDLITWSSFRPAESERRRRPLLRKRTSPAQAKKRLDPLRRYCNLVLPVRAGRCGPLQARSGGSATMQRREVQRRKMQRQKIHLVAAARPNFMKVAPLYHVLKKQDWCAPELIHTGQHYDANMSDSFFTDLGLPAPDHHLGVGSGSHAEQTAAVMVAYEKICQQQRPDWTVVVGDVNSTLARSEEHTSELQSLMRISYAVFCLKKKKIATRKRKTRKMR